MTGQLAKVEPSAMGHRGVPGCDQQRAEGQADRAVGAAARARPQHGTVPQRRGGQEEDRIELSSCYQLNLFHVSHFLLFGILFSLFALSFYIVNFSSSRCEFEVRTSGS